MRKREQADIEVRMLTIDEGATYTGRGRTVFRRWADQIGATRRFGRSVRYDKRIIDAALDAMTEETETSQQGKRT